MNKHRPYQLGETVAVSLPPAVVSDVLADGDLVVEIAGRLITIPADGATVSRKTPADGEPSPGELWADAADNLYFARTISGTTAVELAAAVGGARGDWLNFHRGETGPIRRIYRPEPHLVGRHDACQPVACIFAGAPAAETGEVGR